MKLNSASRHPGLFDAEAQGLQLLAETATVRVPEVLGVAKFQQQQVLLLEWIEAAPAQKNFSAEFGSSLAALHRHSAERFGLAHHNHIGSLPQDNTQEQSLPLFFMQRRLEPQLRLALRSGRLSPSDLRNFERLYRRLEQWLPDEMPALVHGDLWKGNVLTGPEGLAWLIDPAVAYSCREADLAMTRLFGGFDEAFYSSYHDAWPLEAGWEERVDLWNLYPMLVHVNLFGSSYVQELRKMLGRYIRPA